MLATGRNIIYSEKLGYFYNEYRLSSFFKIKMNKVTYIKNF